MNNDKWIGKKFGCQTILSFSYSDNRYRKYFNCRCDCGNEKVIGLQNIIGNPVRCRECKKENLQSHIGKRYNKWTVLSFAETKIGQRNQPTHYYLCRCECGSEHIISLNNLKSGWSRQCKRCGVFRPMARSHNPLIYIYNGMIIRCYNVNDKRYKNYGLRGITVCDRWRDSFENFVADMGERPSPQHSIDRINNDGNYEPSNCRWATQKEQMNNTRKSNQLIMMSLSKITGLSRERIRQIWKRDLLPFVEGYIGKSPVFNDAAIDFINSGKHKHKTWDFVKNKIKLAS